MGDFFTTRFNLKGPSSGNGEHLQNNKLFQLPCITLHTTYILHSEEFPAVLLLAREEKLKWLFYTTLCCPMMDRWVPKQVGAGVL